jgi:hypothetical protein
MICGFLLLHSPAPTMFYALSALAAVGGLLCFISGRQTELKQK